MTPGLETFRFLGFRLRPARPEDLPLAAEWTQADPDHRGRVAPEFWLEQRPGFESYLVRDNGGPLFFIKMVSKELADRSPAVELHIQFSPTDKMARRQRVMDALIQGFKWLESELAEKGIRTVYFESRNPQLMQFCRKRLGFGRTGFLLSKGINPSPAP